MSVKAIRKMLVKFTPAVESHHSHTTMGIKPLVPLQVQAIQRRPKPKRLFKDVPTRIILLYDAIEQHLK